MYDDTMIEKHFSKNILDFISYQLSSDRYCTNAQCFAGC